MIQFDACAYLSSGLVDFFPTNQEINMQVHHPTNLQASEDLEGESSLSMVEIITFSSHQMFSAAKVKIGSQLQGTNLFGTNLPGWQIQV